MAAKHISRRFARQAKRQFNPFGSKATTSEANTARSANTGEANTAPQAQAPSQTNTALGANTARSVNTDPRYYIRKHRVGNRTVSQYVSARDGAADMRLVDMVFRQAALHFRSVAKEFITTIKLLHAINESTCNTIEAEVTTVLNGLGYHRINRGPWRKARIPNAQLIGNTAPQASTPAKPNTGFPLAPSGQRGSSEEGRSTNTSEANTASVLEARLEAHIAEGRQHITDIEELYHSVEVRARSKTVMRLYTRYTKRANSQLKTAEKTLAIVGNILQKGSRSQPE